MQHCVLCTINNVTTNVTFLKKSILCILCWQVEHEDCSPNNVTLGYYVTSGKTVYIPSLVVEVLSVYGFDKLLSDIRQHTPLVKAVLVPVEPWMPVLSIHLQVKTGEENKQNKANWDRDA